ncbi:MAG: glyoxylase-like metal-dependent hydrolase (beta-lactamase superfamily II) [Phenylobacterium sp.]|jgi:glyoxylase-like metal-dependent hydrolase (beta-lactamase superfamily II)
MIKITSQILCAGLLLTACAQPPQTPDSAQSHWYDVMPRASWSKYPQFDTSQDWFEVYQLSDNTYAIYEPNQWQEAISYLLIGSEKALLVDTLQGIGDLKAVVDQLTNLPVIVINTHSHFDHVSGNFQFETVYGVNQPFALENAKGHPHEYSAEYVTPETFWQNIPKGFSIDAYDNKAYEIDHYVNNGEIIDIGGRPIEVVAVPGHTPDSLILVDRKNRMMITGDSFYPAPLYLYFEESSFQDYFNSVQTMLSYRDEVDFLLPGHNETMQPVAYLDKLRAATLAVLDPATPSAKDEGLRNYQFDGFRLLVKDPLDYQ